MTEILFMGGFLLLVALLLTLDLGVFHKKDHVISFKEATVWTCVWIGTALLFCLFIFFKAEWIHGIETMEQLVAINAQHGHKLALEGLSFEEGIKLYRNAMSIEYLTGYLVEKSLSIDNIFVMIMIFMAFNVEKIYYHRVLFYGILGAIVLRFIFIFAAAALIQKFHWILILFGLILIFTGVKMFLQRNKKEDVDVKHHPVVKFLTKYKLATSQFHNHDFFLKSKETGKWLATPLFVVLLIVEFSDVIFAFDSIPAIFSITQDPYIVFFSNIFAILGLRSLFFMLESVMDKFHYLKIGLAVLLTFIGVKMLLPDLCGVHIETNTSLLVILGVLIVSIAASLIFPPKAEE